MVKMSTRTKVCDIHRLHLCIPVCAFAETQYDQGEGPGGEGAVHKNQQRREGVLSVSQNFRITSTQSEEG